MFNTRNLRKGKKPYMALRLKDSAKFGKGAVPKGYASSKYQIKKNKKETEKIFLKNIFKFYLTLPDNFVIHYDNLKKEAVEMQAGKRIKSMKKYPAIFMPASLLPKTLTLVLVVVVLLVVLRLTVVL